MVLMAQEVSAPRFTLCQFDSSPTRTGSTAYGECGAGVFVDLGEVYHAVGRVVVADLASFIAAPAVELVVDIDGAGVIDAGVDIAPVGFGADPHWHVGVDEGEAVAQLASAVIAPAIEFA